MKKILHVISSPRGEESISIRLGNSVIERLTATFPGSTVTIEDINKNQYPHLYDEQIRALRTNSSEHTDAQKELVKRSDEAIAELRDTDVLIISLPLYNFGIPSPLKSWIDNVLRAGHTFSYTADGPRGLMKDKKVYIAIASGGVYSEGPFSEFDFAVPYLKAVLAFIGITDVTVLRAEGTAVSGLMDSALEKAVESITV